MQQAMNFPAGAIKFDGPDPNSWTGVFFDVFGMMVFVSVVVFIFISKSQEKSSKLGKLSSTRFAKAKGSAYT